MTSLNYDEQLKSAKWEKMQAANGKKISSNNFITMSVTQDNSVYDLVCNEWKLCPKLKLLHISVGYDGTIIGIDTKKHLVIIEGNHYSNYRERVFHDRQNWIDVEIHDKDFIVGIIENQSIFTGSTAGFFEELGGKLVWLSVGIDKCIFGVNREQKIYKMLPNTKNWIEIKGRAAQIACYDKDHAIFVGTDGGRLWRRKGEIDEEPYDAVDDQMRFQWLELCKDRMYGITKLGEFYERK